MSTPVGGRLRGFWSSAAWYLGGALVLQGFNFLMQLIFPTLMPPSAYGLAANYLFWMTLFGLLVGLQINATLNNAIHTWGEGELDNYEHSVLPAYLLPAAALAIPIVIGREWWTATIGLPWPYLLLAVFNGMCFARVNLASARAVATGFRSRYLILTGVSSLGSAVLGLSFVLLMPHNTALGRVLGYAVTFALIVATLTVKGWRQERRTVTRYLPFALALSLPLLAHEVLFLISTQSNRVFVLRMLGEAPAGVFSFAYTVGNLAVIAATAVNSAWTPWYFARTREKDNDQVWVNARQLLSAFIVALAAVLLASPELYAIVAPGAYREGSRLVPWFIFVGMMIFVFNVAANTIIYAQRTRLILVTSAIGMVSNVALMLLLIPRFGMSGAAMASAASTFAIALTALAMAKWLIEEVNLPYPHILGLMVGALGCLGLGTWLLDQPLLRWGLAGVLMVGLLVAVGRLWRIRRRMSRRT